MPDKNRSRSLVALGVMLLAVSLLPAQSPDPLAERITALEARVADLGPVHTT